jgi:hypothetical protein
MNGGTAQLYLGIARSCLFSRQARLHVCHPMRVQGGLLFSPRASKGGRNNLILSSMSVYLQFLHLLFHRGLAMILEIYGIGNLSEECRTARVHSSPVVPHNAFSHINALPPLQEYNARRSRWARSRTKPFVHISFRMKRAHKMTSDANHSTLISHLPRIHILSKKSKRCRASR